MFLQHPHRALGVHCIAGLDITLNAVIKCLQAIRALRVSDLDPSPRRAGARVLRTLHQTQSLNPATGLGTLSYHHVVSLVLVGAVAPNNLFNVHVFCVILVDVGLGTCSYYHAWSMVLVGWGETGWGEPMRRQRDAEWRRTAGRWRSVRTSNACTDSMYVHPTRVHLKWINNNHQRIPIKTHAITHIHT